MIKIGSGMKANTSVSLSLECIQRITAHLEGTNIPVSRFIEDAIWRSLDAAKEPNEVRQ